MEQLVRQEAQRHLANQIHEARLQRQIQARQQAMAWTEATRKKFEEAKERQVKNLARAVTEQVQNAAIQNIEELTRQHDLAMAEIGMAHRAAAGFQNVERLKSLKRLKNDEVAKNRGSTAMMRHLKQKEAEKSKSTAVLKRKEEVRKLEDKISKDLISRRPLSVTNSNVESKTTLRPPEYQQSLAKTLKVADSGEKEKPLGSKTSSHSKVTKTSKGNVPTSFSSDLVLKDKPAKKGVLSEMVRIKSSSPSKAGTDLMRLRLVDERSTLEDLYGVGYRLRNKYMDINRGTTAQLPAPVQSMVRYFDATLPKPEVKYVAPKGLSVKESRQSPDAWEKGRKASEESLQHQRIQELKHDEIAQKASDRGKLAMKKAKLEKEMLEVQNELMEEIDQDVIGTGSQKALLGLENGEVDGAPKLHQTPSSDEFSEVESDEEFSFPSPPGTLKTYDVIHGTSKDRIDGSFLSHPYHSMDKVFKQRPDNIENLPVTTTRTDSDVIASDSFVAEEKNQGSDTHSSYQSRSKISSSSKKSEPSDKIKRSSRSSKDAKHVSSLSLTGLPRVSSKHQDIERDQPDAMKKAKLEKEILQVRNELMEEIDQDKVIGTGSQKALLGLEDREVDGAPKLHQTPSSDEFSAVESDEEFSFPSASGTLKKHDVKHGTSKGLTDDGGGLRGRRTGSDESSALLNLKSKQIDDSIPSQSSKRNTSGSNHSTSSDESSALLNIKIKQIDDSLPSQTSKSNTSGSNHSTSDERSTLLNLKIKEVDDSLPSQSSKSNISGSKHSTSDESSAFLNLKIKEVDDSLPSQSSKPNNSGSTHSTSDESSALKIKQIDDSVRRRSSKPKTSGSAHSTSDEGSALKIKQFDDSVPRQSSKPKTSGSKHSTSGESSALKTKQFDDSVPRQSSKPKTSRSKHSTSGESSALVNLKILEQTDSTPSRSEKSESDLSKSDRSGNSGSTTTDYYSLPEGPFTSTPDGKMHPSKHSIKSGIDDSHLDLDNLKRRTLHHYMDKFLQRRPDSIENLPVTTSSSSIIKADSDVLHSDSFAAEEKNQSSETHSSYQSRFKLYSSSKKSLATLYEARVLSESGSTIAQAAIVAGKIVSTNTTSDSSARESEPSDNTKRSSGSSKEAEPVSSDSLTGLLRVLSEHQDIERDQLDFDEIIFEQDLERPIISSITRSNNPYQSSNADSSQNSIPDASAILRRIVSRPSRRSTSRASSSSSPKSGPERETKRVELLDDVTPIRLWETPPRLNHSGANETEKLSAVFESLIDKWSNLRIEKPPWTPFSDHNE